jgi:hypothetical protein
MVLYLCISPIFLTNKYPFSLGAPHALFRTPLLFPLPRTANANVIPVTDSFRHPFYVSTPASTRSLGSLDCSVRPSLRLP